jgi:hypothetical protein
VSEQHDGQAVRSLKDAVLDLRRATLELFYAEQQRGGALTCRLEVQCLIRQLERLLPLTEKELRGEKYVRRCCGVAAFQPFGLFDETLCGWCYNGSHEPERCEGERQKAAPAKAAR